MSGELLIRYPEAALLLIPAAVAWWMMARRGHGRWWRALILLLLVLAAMDPEIAWQRGGSDVVVVVDRSRSMGPARAGAQELVKLTGEQRERGDRLGVVLFGEGQILAQAPQPEGVPRLADFDVADGASDLAAALEHAHSLIGEGRTGRVLVISDGEFTGLGPRRAAAALALDKVPVDVLPVERPSLPDAAVAAIELPDGLRRGESFIGAVTFVGDARARRKYVIRRGDTIVREGEVDLHVGRPTTLSFADRPPRPGVARYTVELDATEDRVPDNNRATGVLRVGGGERVLVMGGDGAPGNLAKALTSAGIEVETRPEGPIDLETLLGYRALVLEQVPAGKLTSSGITAVARWVEHMGGGLVLTGGRRSFGGGGYHKSAIEEVLPVTMEIRDEHRKASVAMAMTLDRSGSMGVQVAGGRTKMQLANSGAIASVELLTARDEVAVHAVDEAAHVIVPLTRVVDPEGLVAQISGIRSQGGGIFVYEALEAAAAELLQASTSTRHLVMFADAADAEQPGAYRKLVGDLQSAGITVSVIGLGTERDVDARLLKDIAQLGGGRAWFADRAEDLPRLFAQETLLVARGTWIDDPVKPQPQAMLAATLGPRPELQAEWPLVPGYNLNYARPEASVLALAPGDPVAPAIAVWQAGTGRSGAVAFSLDDPKSGALLAWHGYAPLVSGLTRWVGGGAGRAPGALYAERAGRSVTLRLELDPAMRARWPAAAPHLVLTRAGEVAEPSRLPMQPVDDGVFEARLELDDERPLIPSVALPGERGAEAVVGPALALPYSPELEPRYSRESGATVLAEIARQTGGQVRSDVLELYDNPQSPGELASLSPFWLAALALLLLLEIATRRLRLGGRAKKKPAPRRAPAARPAAPEPEPEPADADAPAEAEDPQGLHEALRELRRRGRR